MQRDIVTRVCNVCNKEKPICKFATMGKKKSHIRRRTCMECLNKKYSNYYKEYRKKHYQKRRRFKWKNSTHEEQIEHMKKIFEGNVIKKEGCWNWKRDINAKRYVKAYYLGHNIGAHRASWILHKGQIPEGMYVLHKCDNPRCTNPEHLFLGTPLDNMQDKTRKGRSKYLRGSEKCEAKLDEKKIKKIRNLLKLGVTATRIAKDFNVCRQTISDIKRGKTWKHVT